MWWLMLGLWACQPEDTAPVDDTAPELPPVEAAEAPGPYGAGYRESSVTYDPGDGSGSRTLRLAMWYPSDETTGDEVKYAGVFAAPGVIDAPPAAAGPFPLVVFSHGHQGMAENLGSVMQHLATRGYVAVAPEHTGNTTFDDATRLTPIYYQRMSDVSATLDHVLGGAEADLPALDGHVLGMGHSFGGYTMLALLGAQFDMASLNERCAVPADDGICSTWSTDAAARFAAGMRDDRIEAGVIIAAGDFRQYGAAGVAAVSVPVLHMTGGLDTGNATDAPLYWDALPAPSWRAHTEHGAHTSWTDFATGPSDSQPDLIPADRGKRIGQVYSAAFADYQLGDARMLDVLDGTGVVDEDVTVSVH